MSLLLLLGQTAPLLGNPTGGAVVAGSATIGPAGSTLSINQSTQNAIINWQQFSIASGETTKFIVPNSGATLNRVTGGNPSAIYGNLQSNGTLYLVNPSGIVVGPSGRIDTAGFLASTLDISNQQFLAGGNLEFAGSSGASVENDGVIHASSGDVYLIANQVTNKGTLNAPQGTVGLAAGSDVLFQQAGNQHLFVQATPTSARRALGVTNSGTIRAAAAELKAAGGNAYALAINNTGVIAATGYKKINGQVYLTSDGGSISNSGRISAKQANGNGGTILMDGTAVASTVSGTVTNSGTLDASATVAGGQGGAVMVKNMGGTTRFSGKIIAKGGQGGTGGSVEVSGATVGFAGTVDLTSPGGTTGNLLLDPLTFTVAATGGDETGAAVSATLQTANLTLNADNGVAIEDAITWTSATTLTLSTNTSGGAIVIAAPISGVNGGLTIDTAAATDGVAATGSVDVASFILQSGSWTQDSATLPAFTASHDFELKGSSSFIRIAGLDSANNNAEEITDVYGLQGLASPSGDQLNTPAELVDNIDASGTATWNSGAGFVPIGFYDYSSSSDANTYAGTFNGAGHVINGLTINLPSNAAGTGLFGDTAVASTIENLSLTNVSINGATYVGALAGVCNSTVSDVYVSGTVAGSTYVGGMLGISSGTISNSYSTASVTGSGATGGLDGDQQFGFINDCYSSGAVTGTGGLVGISTGTVTNSFWDTTTSGLSTSAGGTGDGTAALLASATYSGAGWSIGTDPTTDTWVILAGQTRPMLAMEYNTTITNAHQLQLIDLNSTTLAASYTLANDIDASGTTNASDVWGTSTGNGGAGFASIGSGSSAYSGTFNGENNTINDLYVYLTSGSAGLFGNVASGGTVENLGVTNAQVTGAYDVGLVVGSNLGTINDAYSTGTVRIGTSDDAVGGLVGANAYVVTDSYSGATVFAGNGADNVGGFAGFNSGSMSNVYSTGAVNVGTGGNGEGGLVGYNAGGNITNAYSTGTITFGAGTSPVGGFAGYNNGVISGGFWDTATSGQTTGIGGGTLTGVTGSTTTSGTNNLLALATYSGAGWSIGTNQTSDAWVIFDGQTRPLLSMEYSTTITNAHQLQLIGLNSTTLAASYTLANNIDASGTTNAVDVWGTSTTNGGTGFVPIGNGTTSFTGTFNGQGHTINSLYIDAPNSGFLGLFGDTGTSSVIENVGLTNAAISGSNVPVDEYIGGLVGYGQGTIEGSYVTGSVSSTGDTYVGGLVGLSYTGMISSCYNTATVTGTGDNAFVGGLAGESNSGSSILNCYNSGTISGFDVGGLVGYNVGPVTDSYSDGLVSGTGTLGALFFYNGGLITNGFWDTTTAGVGVAVGNGSSTGIVGATTVQLESQSYIAANATASPTYDFTNIWTTHAGTTTPELIVGGVSASAPTLDTLTGTAFTDSGITDAASGTTIDLVFDGSLLGSTTTNSSGGFSFSVNATDLTSGILLTDATDNGNTFYQANSPASTISGIDIWGSTLRTMGDTASTPALAAAAGSLSSAGINYTVNGTFLSTNAGVNLNLLSNYALDGVVAANNIAVNSALTTNTSDFSVLICSGTITVNANITNSGGGGINLVSGNLSGGVGTVVFNNGAKVSTSGAVNIFFNPSVNPAGSAVNTTSYVNPTENYTGDVAGGATLTAYMLVNTLNDLQNVQNNLSGTYALGQDIDATPTSGWNGGAGFVPIGNNGTPFIGAFNGQNNAIDGLTINTPAGYDIGLFGNLGSGAVLQNFGVTNLQISGTDYVGGIVGNNNGGSVMHVYATGTVSGPADTDAIGGLAGANTGTFIDCYSTVAVNAPNAFGNVGGALGVNYGTISNSFALGAVDGSGASDVGGFVGQLSGGTVTNCYSTGSVTGAGEVGGFIGVVSGTVTNCFWDTETSGQENGSGGGTVSGEIGATTAQLTSQAFILANATTSPTYDFTNVWTTVGDTLTPQLIGLPQTSLPTGSSLDTLSGTAFTDSGVTMDAANTTIDLIFDGSLLGSTTTNGSGGFSFSISATDLAGGILLTDPAHSGNAYYQANSPAGTISGIDIWGSTLRVTADAASNTALATAAGTLAGSGINYAVSGGDLTTNSGINMNILASYTLDGNVYADGLMTTNAASVLGASSVVSLSGNSVNLAGTINDSDYILVKAVAGDITVTGPVTSTTPNLIMLSTGNINVDANISAANVTLQSDLNGTGIGTVTFNDNAEVSGASNVLIFYNPSVNPAGSSINTTSYVNPTENYAPDVAVGTTLSAYMLVNTLNDLQNVQNNLTGDYALSHDIDATATSGWNGGAGFVPIGNGNGSSFFTGAFNGQNYTINGLSINRPTTNAVGLFGAMAAGGTIFDLGVTNAQITGQVGVGSLVGQNGQFISPDDYTSGGSVTNSYSTGVVSSGDGTSGCFYIGGLVGENTGSSAIISNSYSTATVNGSFVAGGLAGYNYYGTIDNSYSTGAVTGVGGSTDVGGLTGFSSAGTIDNVYSTGAVTVGTGSSYVGGLAGQNLSGATINNAYSTGAVTMGSGSTEVGAFVGDNESTISNSFFDSQTSALGLAVGSGSTAGVTGATTTQLETQSFFPGSWDFTTPIWTTVGNTLTAQLVGLPETALPVAPVTDTLSGTAFTDSGSTIAGADTSIDLIFDGSLLGSTTTNGSGGFSFSISASDLMGGILLTDATHNGNTYYQANAPTSSITGIDIWGSTLRVLANTASNTALGTAAGSLSGAGINYSVNAAALATNSGVNMQITSPYTLDGNITASGSLTTTFVGSLTSSVAAVSLSGSSINLGGSLTSSGQVTINSPGTVLDSAGLSVGSFILENGTWTQIVGQNGLASLPSFTDSGDFELQNSSTFERFAGGTGSSGTPYQIADIFGLQGLGSPSNALEAANAELINNIDATTTAVWNSSAGFAPIGFNTPYTATFNGQGYTINALQINRGGTNAVGLFSIATDLLENVNLTNVQVSGYDYVGALAGATGNTIAGYITTGIVQDCSSSGTVTSGSLYVGGLVGLDHGTLIVSSYTAGTVSGGGYVGGLTGSEGSQVNDDYSTASVTATGGPVGGLVGENYTNGIVLNCYSTGVVTGTSEVGGLVGRDINIVENSFWDTSTSGITSSTGGVGSGSDSGVTPATTAQLESQTFILANAPVSPTWDFTHVWTTNGGTTTPQLIGLPQNLPTGTPDLLSGTVYSDSGVTLSAGTLVDLIFDGGILGSTTTSGSGTFSFTINSNDLGSGVLLTSPANAGDAFYQANSPASTITGIDIWGSTLRVTADTASNAALKLAAGSLTSSSGVNYSVSGANLSTLSGVSVNVLSGYTLDGNITAAGTGSFTTGEGAVLSGSSNVTLTGSTVTLAGAASLTGTLTVTSTSGQILLTGFGSVYNPNTAAGVTLNSAGAVLLSDSDLSLNGGNFSATGTGYVSSSDANGEANGINLFDSTIDAGGGNITLTGTAGYTSTGSGLASGLGVAIGTDGELPMALSTTGNGDITINGTCNQNITSQLDFFGVEVYTDSGESSNSITVANGTLSINGTITRGATTTSGQGLPASLAGVKIAGGSVVQATGSGNVVVTGNATGASVDGLLGVEVTGSTASVVDGNLTLHGTVAGTSSIASVGVGVVNSAVVQSTGAGSVTVDGESTGSTSSFNSGVYVDDASLASSGSSGLAVTGNAGTVTGATDVVVNGNEYNPFSTGIFLNNGASLTASNTGSVRLTGTGGPNDSTAPLDAYGGDYGVYFDPFASSNTQVTSSGGGLSITGTGGTGAGSSYNGGIYVGPATIQDTGDGAVTLTGTAGAGVDNNIGLTIEGDGTVVQAGSGESSGVLTLNGSSSSGDTGQDNNGVAIFSGAAINSGGGGISITGASPANGTNTNDSVAIGGVDLTAVSGTLRVASTAGDISLNANDTATNSVISSPVGTTATLTNPGGSVSLSGGNYVLTQSTDLILDSVSVQDLDLNVTGNITQTAPMTAALLSVASANALTLTNPGNNITALGSIALTGALLISTDPGTTLSGAITDTAPITIAETGGDIVFGPNGSITDSGEGNNVILAAGTNLANSHYFINNANTSAIQVSSGANFYIYSSDPTYDTFGNITVLPVNMIYGATYPPSGLPSANQALFFVGTAGEVGPNNPNAQQMTTTPPPSTSTGGAAGAGSTIVPPALVPQTVQVTQPGNPVVTTTANGSAANGDEGSQPPPFSFVGSGLSTVEGQMDGGLASSAGNSGQVTSGDAAQMNDGQLNSVANPQASSTLNEALGPIVYQNLSDALKEIGDWADVPASAGDNTASDSSGETILTGGDVAEMTSSSVKSIPLDQAPEALQKAMNTNALNGTGVGH